MAKYLYVARCDEHNKTKIGITDNIKRRMKDLSYQQGASVVAVYKSAGMENAEVCEKQALACCVNRIEGEWFNCTIEHAILCVTNAVSLLGVDGGVKKSNKVAIMLSPFKATKAQDDWLKKEADYTGCSQAAVLRGLIQEKIFNANN